MPKHVSLLIRILGVALGLTFLLVLAMFLSSFLMMSGNIGGMGMMGPSMFTAMLWPSILVAVIVAVVGVAAYNLLLPKINPTRISEEAPANYRDAVLRLLKDDERQFVEVLTKNGGTAFQRDLQHATGFSKVKTHRVIARLAERRLVAITPAGKTNQIRIPSWLLGDNEDTSN
jgi:hypothetical protein